MFLTEDLEKAKAFGVFVSKHAKWTLDTAGVIQLNRHLAYFNSLLDKIDAHILEVRRTIKASEAQDAAKKGKAK